MSKWRSELSGHWCVEWPAICTFHRPLPYTPAPQQDARSGRGSSVAEYQRRGRCRGWRWYATATWRGGRRGRRERYQWCRWLRCRREARARGVRDTHDTCPFVGPIRHSPQGRSPQARQVPRDREGTASANSGVLNFQNLDKFSTPSKYSKFSNV